VKELAARISTSLCSMLTHDHLILVLYDDLSHMPVLLKPCSDNSYTVYSRYL
jgi:hypothetical protein